MIIILTYYSDGSAPPSLEFFPKSDENNFLYICGYIADEAGLGKVVKIWQVDDLSRLPKAYKDYD